MNVVMSCRHFGERNDVSTSTRTRRGWRDWICKSRQERREGVRRSLTAWSQHGSAGAQLIRVVVSTKLKVDVKRTRDRCGSAIDLELAE